MITMPIMGEDKDSICDLFQTMHSAQRARTQRPIRKQTGSQEQKCVSGQKIIRQRVCTSKCNDHTNSSDDSKANPHHGGGDCENVDTDILLQMRVWVAVPVHFSFHGNPLLDQSQNRLFRQ